MVASYWSVEDGKVRFFPNFAQALWLNGVRQDTIRDYGAIFMKPGDMLITGYPKAWHSSAGNFLTLKSVFLRYRFDRLTSTRAYFKRWAYDSIGEHLYSRGTLYRMGALEASDQFQLSITQSPSVIDGGAGVGNYVEIGNGIPVRTK